MRLVPDPPRRSNSIIVCCSRGGLEACTGDRLILLICLLTPRSPDALARLCAGVGKEWQFFAREGFLRKEGAFP
eukprot:5531433-Pyramimonas_sp.AAC.1